MFSNVKRKINRRSFFKHSSLGMFGAGLMDKADFLRIRRGINEDLPKVKTYRMLGRTGFEVSDIGCGMGTIPDEDFLKALIKSGVNYFDNAESYQNGRMETLMGNCLKEIDRKSIFITTKTLLQENDTKDKILTRARQSLERLRTEYVDCFMLHSAKSSEMVQNKAFQEAMQQLKSEGRVRSVGMSCHGAGWNVQEFQEPAETILMTAVDSGQFDVILFVYNFLQKEMGDRVLKACKKKNIGTTIMKSDPVTEFHKIEEMIDKRKADDREIPGYLNILHRNYSEKYAQAKPFIEKHGLKNKSEIRDAAIRWILDNPNAHTVCISFQTYEDIENYVKLSGQPFSTSDTQMLHQYQDTFGQFYCRHSCGLCESRCPHGVPINRIMRYNHYFVAQRREKYAMQKYASLSHKQAKQCETCQGFCESACPYHVPIQGLLSLADDNLTLC